MANDIPTWWACLMAAGCGIITLALASCDMPPAHFALLGAADFLAAVGLAMWLRPGDWILDRIERLHLSRGGRT